MEAEIDPNEALLSADDPQIVLLIHGIRTQGTWAEMVRGVLEQDPNVKVQPIRYGFFDTFSFLSPFFTRERVVKRFVQEYRDIKQRYPNSKISAIAHSFGTYALVKALNEHDVKLYKIILCGSIVPDNFRVSNHASQIEFNPILNECGTRDIWPPIAKSVTWGYGSSGTFGFGTVGIRDRFNNFSHSEYFSKSFVNTYWKPYISDGHIVATPWEESRDSPPYWHSLLSIFPLRWLFVGLLVLVAGLSWQYNERSKIAETIISSPLWSTHLIGTTEVAINVSLNNMKSEVVAFSGFSATLISPNSVPTELVPIRYHIQYGSPAQPIPQKYFVDTGVPWNFILVLQDEYTKQNILLNEVRAYFQKEKIYVEQWARNKDIVSADLTQKLTKLAKNNFIWEAGEWTLNLVYYVDGVEKRASIKFSLTESGINRMKSSIPFYSTGMGILPNWLYMSPSGENIIQQTEFSAQTKVK